MMHDDINCVLFIVAISEYDLNCFEDEETNRLDEAFNLFQKVIDKGFCTGKTVTFFFNKFDLFQQKLNDPHSTTIADIYSDFPKTKNPRDVEDVVQYIYGRFLKIFRNGVKNQNLRAPHYHLTTALDTQQIELLLHDIETDLIKTRVLDVGF